MHSKVLDAFEKVRYRLHNGDYHTKFDAMSIASVELDKLVSIHDIERVNIIGLEKLCSDISQILNTGVVDQQAIIALAKDEYSLLTHIAETSRHISISEEEKISWDSLPEALDHDLPKNRPSLLSVVLTRKELHGRLQRVHNDLQELMEAKLCAFEFVDSLIFSYADGLSDLATESSQLKGAEEKVLRVLEPRLHTLMTHRFLNTAETREVLRSVRELASSTYMRGSTDLAECKFNVENRKVASARETFSGFSMSSCKMGAVLILLLWGLSECFNNEKMGRDVWHDPTFSIFICLGDLTLLLFMWGVSLRVWRLAGINYIKLLSLEQSDLAQPALSFRPEQAEQIVLNSATDLSLVFLTAFVLFNKALRGSFSLEGEPAAAHAIPVILLLFYAVRLALPYQTRKVYFEMLWKVLAAPWHPVVFRDGYVGDLLTSLVRVSVNLSFSIIYVILTGYWWISNHLSRAESVRMPVWEHSTGFRFGLIPFLTLLPLWLRLMQCLRRSVETGKRWPHYFNALKYCSAMVVFSFSAFRPGIQTNPLWVVGLVGATCYQFAWDITMDWGLLQLSPNGNFFIRRERSMFSDNWYAAVIVLNFILRFSWAITLMPQHLQKYSTLYWYVFNNFQTLMAAAEIVRRMVWGFLRLEWEHIERYGTAPVSPSGVEALRRAQVKSKAARRKTESEQQQHQERIGLEDKEQNVLRSLDLEKMPIGEVSKEGTARSDSFVHWEWIGHYSSWVDSLLTDYSPAVLGQMASGHSFSSYIWVARLTEAVALTVSILMVMAIAAFGGS